MSIETLLTDTKGAIVMACFIAPVTEAIVVTVADKMMKKSEKEENKEVNEITFKSKLPWLSKLLFGGSALLCFEHIWHGEVTLWFPFLTAASNPADAAVMLKEIATVGGTMAIWLTTIWVAMVLAAKAIVNRKPAYRLKAK